MLIKKKGMKKKGIREIIRPYREDVPVNPSLTIDDKIVQAVELMLDNNLKDIAVLRKGLPIGIVRLEEALLNWAFRSLIKNDISP